MIFNRKPIYLLIFLGLTACLFQSCFPKGKLLGVFNRTSVKNPPKDTFVFSNEIHITPGIVSKDEQNRLESELDSYWDDSVKARTVQQFGVFYRIKEPQPFDTFALDRSRLFMQSYLQSQGYYSADLKDSFRIDTFKYGKSNQQFRAIPMMFINPGKRLKLDSIDFNFIDTSRLLATDSILQNLALEKKNESLLKKGDFYSKQIIASELDRLTSWFRQNGYYKLTREHLAAYVDTTDQLIDSLTIDPFELARRIAAANEIRRQNPTADITLLQATKVKEIPFDSTAVIQYRIGNIYYYPETGGTDIVDTLMRKGNFNVRDSGYIFMKYPGNNTRFNFKPFVHHTFITKGELYNERLFYKTLNTFGQMGPWSQVEIRDSIHKDTVDFHVFLTPYKKKNVKFDFELTRSTADFVSSNNLFGVGGNGTLLVRNFLHEAIQSVTTGRAGVELNLEATEGLIQTFQAGVGQTFVIPHVLFASSKFQKWFDAARTTINLNGSYTERKEFYRLRSFIFNPGIETVKGNWSSTTRFPNFELYSLDVLPSLEDAFKSNPFLKTAFNTGNVASIIHSSTLTWISGRKRNVTNSARFGIEWAGFAGLLGKNFYNYEKIELEGIRKIQGLKTMHVLRAFAGIGIPNGDQQTLPFFKQFVAGGPNSMRAWGLRQLGLGRSKLSDTSKTFRDRFGDLQIEFNYEYRFPLTNFGSAKFSSAIFMDVGNIWNIKNDPTNPDGTFKFKPLPDFAVAAGIGLLRLNVANFVFRVDFALKIKDPAVRENNGWLLKKFTWKNENDRNNYAFQIGIGLPF